MIWNVSTEGSWTVHCFEYCATGLLVEAWLSPSECSGPCFPLPYCALGRRCECVSSYTETNKPIGVHDNVFKKIVYITHRNWAADLSCSVRMRRDQLMRCECPFVVFVMPSFRRWHVGLAVWIGHNSTVISSTLKPIMSQKKTADIIFTVILSLLYRFCHSFVAVIWNNLRTTLLKQLPLLNFIITFSCLLNILLIKNTKLLLIKESVVLYCWYSCTAMFSVKWTCKGWLRCD